MPRSQSALPPLKHMWHIVNFIWICFTFGVLVVTVLKMLTRTRKRVTRRAILPGMTSMGMRKEIQETITNRPALDKCVFSESQKHCPTPNFQGHWATSLIVLGDNQINQNFIPANLSCFLRSHNSIYICIAIKVETWSKKNTHPQITQLKSTSFTIVFFLEKCKVVHLYIRSTIWPN